MLILMTTALILSRYTYTSDERFRAIHKVSLNFLYFSTFCLLSLSENSFISLSFISLTLKVLSEDYLLQILPVKVIYRRSWFMKISARSNTNTYKIEIPTKTQKQTKIQIQMKIQVYLQIKVQVQV